MFTLYLLFAFLPTMMFSFNLQDFPYEVVVHIMEGLDSYERSKGCTVSTLFEKACIEASKNLSSYRLYYEEASILRKLCHRMYYQRTDKYIHVELNETIYTILDESDYHLVVRMKNKWTLKYDYKIGTIGYEPMINLYFQLGINITEMLHGACAGNHLELSTMLLRENEKRIKEYKNSDSSDEEEGEEEGEAKGVEHIRWVDLFAYAGESGNKNMVDMIYAELRAMGFTVGYEYMPYVFFGACQNGHVDLCKWIIGECRKNNVDFEEDRLVREFEAACSGGYLPIVTFLVEEFDIMNNVGYDDQIYNAIYEAAFYGHIDVIEYLSKLHFGDFWESALEGACKGGKMHIIDLVKKNVKNTPIECKHCHMWLNGGHI